MLVSETAGSIRVVDPIFLTATDTAVALAGDAAEVDELIAAGEIKAATIRGRIRVSYASLVAYRDRVLGQGRQ